MAAFTASYQISSRSTWTQVSVSKASVYVQLLDGESGVEVAVAGASVDLSGLDNGHVLSGETDSIAFFNLADHVWVRANQSGDVSNIVVTAY